MNTGEVSWSGLGVGTSKQAFLQELAERVPDLPAERVAVEVFGALVARLSGGLVHQLLDELPADLREFFLLHGDTKDLQERAEGLDKEAFYLRVAERLDVDPNEVRRVLHGCFAALHGQTTETVSEKVQSELPDELRGTWLAARRVSKRPA